MKPGFYWFRWDQNCDWTIAQVYSNGMFLPHGMSPPTYYICDSPDAEFIGPLEPPQ